MRAPSRFRTPRHLYLSGALLLGSLLATPAGASAQRFDLLTLRGPGAQIGASFRDVANGPAADQTEGAVVVEVRPKGPAAIAGIRAGDRVTEFDGITVRNARALTRLVAETPPGRTVDVTVIRDGRPRMLKVSPVLEAAARN